MYRWMLTWRSEGEDHYIVLEGTKEAAEFIAEAIQADNLLEDGTARLQRLRPVTGDGPRPGGPLIGEEWNKDVHG